MRKIKVGDFIIGKDEREAIEEVLNSGRISEGSKVRRFEEEWADYIGTRYCVALNSGTSALIAGLTALRIRNKLKGKRKIITTPLSYISTTNAIVLSGFEPVYVDINEQTFVITPENILSLLKDKNPSEYCAILPVHLMGYHCDMDAINSIAEKYNLVVFEDSAEAHGTLYKGKKVGSLSSLSAFSFYIAHNIQAGEFGAITTNDLEISELVRSIKANGRACGCPVCTRTTKKGCPQLLRDKKDEDSDPRFTHNIIGYNFKTTEFPAALALSQIKKADWIVKKRQANVKYLNDRLKNFSHLLQLPFYDESISYLAYPLVIKKPEIIPRKRLRRLLEDKGIETRPLFGCIPTQQPAFNYLKRKYEGKLPTAEYVGLNGFYLGCHQYIEKEDLDYMVECFEEILKDYK